MAEFRPKEILAQAQRAEAKGDIRAASNHYALLSVYLRKKGKLEEAKILIDRAIRLSPKSARLYVQRAVLGCALKDPIAARAAVDLFAHYALEKKKARDYAPYLEQNLSAHPELRLAFYDSVLQIERTKAWPFLGAAKAHEQTGKNELAEKSFLEALKTQEDQNQVLSDLGRYFQQYGQTSRVEALTRFQDKAISFDEFLLLVEPERQKPPGLPKEGKKEKKLRKVANEELYDRGRPQNEERDLKSLIFDLEKELGMELEEKRDTVEPLLKEFLERSEPIVSGDSRARLDLALAFFEMQLFPAAKQELSNIGENDELYLDSQCLLAEVVHSEGSELNALDIYQRCLRHPLLSPEQNLHCLYQLCRIFLHLGDPAKAGEILSQIEKKVPNYRDLKSLKAQIELREKEEERKAS